MPTVYSVLNHFTCIVGDHFKASWVCDHCGHQINTADNRRKIEHFLKFGTSVNACTNANKIGEEATLALREEYAILESELARKRARSAAKKTAVSTLDLPARQRKRQAPLSFDPQIKDTLDMGYARMMFATASKIGFMDSGFVEAYFLDNFNFTPPSRKVILGPLLNAIYILVCSVVSSVRLWCPVGSLSGATRPLMPSSPSATTPASGPTWASFVSSSSR